MTEETIQKVISKTEKPNSYEFGKAHNRIKVYFEDINDLKRQLQEFHDLGIIDIDKVKEMAVSEK